MPQRFSTRRLPAKADAIAPDGSEVRILLGLAGGGMAHFELPPGETTTAVKHTTVEEIWFFLSGRGRMWRALEDQEEIVDVYSGISVTIPVGTHFQFQSTSDGPLSAIGQTMPPWPGDEEAVVVQGIWKPTVAPPDRLG